MATASAMAWSMISLLVVLVSVPWEPAFAEPSYTIPEDGKVVEAMTKAFNICRVANQSDPNSCYGRCDVMSSRTHCGCDAVCLQYGDCCYDYEMQCQGRKGGGGGGDQPMSTSTALKTILGRNISDFIECFDPGTTDFASHWIVSRCPQSWLDDTVKELCEDTITSLSEVPVFGPESVLYKNVFCATCHGVQSGDVEFWNVNFTCSTNETVNKTIPEILQTTLSQPCMKFYFPPENSAYGLRLPCGRTVWSDCVRTNDVVMKKACQSYAAVVSHTRTSSMYKNPHCASCRRAKLDDVQCSVDADGDRFGVFGISFAMLLDFNSNSKLQLRSENDVTESHATCGEHQVYDPFLDKCHQLSCPADFELINGDCQPSLPNPVRGDDISRSYKPIVDEHDGSPAVNTSSSQPTLRLTAVLQTPQSFREPQQRKQLEELLANVISGILKLSPEATLLTNLTQSNSTLSERPHEKLKSQNLYTYNIIFIKPNITLPLLINVLDRKLKSELKLNNLTINVLQVTIDNNSDCKEYTENSVTSDIELTALDDSWSRVTLLHANYSDTWYGENANDWSIILTYDEDSSTWRRKVTILGCNKFPLRCPMIQLDSRYVTFAEGGGGMSVYYEPTNTLYAPGTYNVQNGSIYVCNYLSRNGTRTDNVSAVFFEYSLSQTILTVIGSLLSLLFLVFSFVTYCTFRGLRNLPGKTIMNLIIALFAAQAFLLFGSNQTHHREFCQFVAIATHYFWLAVFCWMNVMAFDICRTFRKRLRLRSSEDRNVLLHRYMLYAWGVPTIIVVICIIVNFCDCANCRIGYGTGSSCWIEEPNALIISFMTPVGAIIVANLVMYLRAIHAIWATSKVAQKVTQKSQTENLKTQLLLYAKLTTIMGFTWIFGFIAAFSAVEAFWYLFIILNSTQGVFIFFAFTFNRRIINMWKRRLSMRRRRRKSQTGVTPSTSSTKIRTTELLSGRVTSL